MDPGSKKKYRLTCNNPFSSDPSYYKHPSGTTTTSFVIARALAPGPGQYTYSVEISTVGTGDGAVTMDGVFRVYGKMLLISQIHSLTEICQQKLI